MPKQSRIAGLVSIVAGVLAAAVSFFRILPEVSRFDADDVAYVVVLAGLYLAAMSILAVFLHLIYQVIRRGAVTLGLFATLLTLATWLGLGIILATPVVGEVVGWFTDDVETEVRSEAAVVATALIVAPYMAYVQWMRYRPEREQQCFHCREWINRDATRCRFCTSDPAWIGAQPPEAPGWPKWFSGF
jgi:hypothetical protein